MTDKRSGPKLPAWVGSPLYLASFIVAFSLVTWLLNLPWYSVPILFVGMIGLRVWAALALRRHRRQGAA